MTIEETKQLLNILKVAYPNTYRSMDKETAKDTILMYHDLFSEYDSVVVVAALKNYIRRNKYPPTPAGLQEQIDLLISDNSDAELWAQIEKAVKNGLYGANDEFEKLPEECQAWLGGPYALKDLAMTEQNVISTVVRGEFLKSIGQVKERKQAIRGLPVETKQAIEKSKQLQIEMSNES